jgi:hypothetical protein
MGSLAESGDGVGPAGLSAMSEQQDEHIRSMMRRAVDQAFMARIGKLFDMWIVDSTGQPERAANGTKKTIAIYKEAVEIIDEIEL